MDCDDAEQPDGHEGGAEPARLVPPRMGSPFEPSRLGAIPRLSPLGRWRADRAQARSIRTERDGVADPTEGTAPPGEVADGPEQSGDRSGPGPTPRSIAHVRAQEADPGTAAEPATTDQAAMPTADDQGRSAPAMPARPELPGGGLSAWAGEPAGVPGVSPAASAARDVPTAQHAASSPPPGGEPPTTSATAVEPIASQPGPGGDRPDGREAARGWHTEPPAHGATPPEADGATEPAEPAEWAERAAQPADLALSAADRAAEPADPAAERAEPAWSADWAAERAEPAWSADWAAEPADRAAEPADRAVPAADRAAEPADRAAEPAGRTVPAAEPAEWAERAAESADRVEPAWSADWAAESR